MTCTDVRSRLSAHADDELPPAEAALVALHLTRCAECAAESEAILRLRSTMQQYLPGLEAPDVLKARIRQQLALAPGAAGAPKTDRAWFLHGSWTAALGRAAAAVLLVAAGSAGALLWTSRSRAIAAPAAGAVVESHVRALMASHLTDVASSAHHTVKPWFAGRIDFSPPVPVLDSLGATLVGARVDSVESKPAAALVYKIRLHVITVFVWRDDQASPRTPEASASRGYNVWRWTRDGLRFAAVSDLNAGELRSVAEAFSGRSQ